MKIHNSKPLIWPKLEKIVTFEPVVLEQNIFFLNLCRILSRVQWSRLKKGKNHIFIGFKTKTFLADFYELPLEWETKLVKNFLKMYILLDFSSFGEPDSSLRFRRFCNKRTVVNDLIFNK